MDKIPCFFPADQGVPARDRFATDCAHRRSFVGFAAAWDHRSDDPDRQPEKLLFGYYCAPRDVALDRRAARAAVEQVVVRPLPEDTAAATALRDREGNVALALARRGASGDGGLPDFPWLLARSYHDDGRDDRRDPKG